MIRPAALYQTPNALAEHYSRFRVDERLLLTGHSHQAWPDVGFLGQQMAWNDAAEHVDEKWSRAFAAAEAVRSGYRRLLDDPDGVYGLGPSTHDLIVKLLSALPLRDRPRIVTTDGEFHSLRRQLDRLAEEGIELVKIPVAPVHRLAEELARATDDRTALVCVSAVLFRNAQIVPDLATVAAACRRVGALLLVDAYHALNVLPFPLAAHDLGDACITGAGYKYCQLGEGNAFLRAPPDLALRPVITGWFSEFSIMTDAPPAGVPYGIGADVFAGATYDPTSNYRAREVFAFFEQHALDPGLLRDVSQHQIACLIDGFDALDLDPDLVTRDRGMALDTMGGFVALQCHDASALHAALRDRGVWTDYRNDILRLGPAPYLADTQLEATVAALGDATRAVSRSATPTSQSS